MSYAEFATKTGLTSSSLFRLDNGEQSITLTRLHGLLKRLKVTLTDVFNRVVLSCERCFRLTRRGYIDICNRMEGFVPATLKAITDELDRRGVKCTVIK